MMSCGWFGWRGGIGGSPRLRPRPDCHRAAPIRVLSLSLTADWGDAANVFGSVKMGMRDVWAFRVTL